MIVAPAAFVSLLAMLCPAGAPACTALPEASYASWADCVAAREDLRAGRPEVVAACVDRRRAPLGEQLPE